MRVLARGKEFVFLKLNPGDHEKMQNYNGAPMAACPHSSEVDIYHKPWRKFVDGKVYTYWQVDAITWDKLKLKEDPDENEYGLVSP